MNDDYQLMTDSSCDLPDEFLKQEDIISIPLSFSIEGKKYFNGEMNLRHFYALMRNGATPITSQVNVAQAVTAFESILKKGRDILYIAFSSGMSGTFGSVSIAAQELRPKYPDRKIIVVDSLSVTLGQGLLVYLTNQMKKAGESLDKTAEWVHEHAKNVAHFVTVKDINHVFRGGRISRASAFVGSLLNIQPIIRLNEKGEAEVIAKKRGRINALNSMVEHMCNAVGNTVNNICFIGHADSEDDAFYLRDQARKLLGIQKFFIAEAGPVIGAHVGPGGMVISAMADRR